MTTHDALPDDELRALAEAATRGPWEVGRFFWKVGSTRGLADGWWQEVTAETGTLCQLPEGDAADGTYDPDLLLIAAMRNALPSLLDRLAHAEARTAEAVEAGVREALDEVERRLAPHGPPCSDCYPIRRGIESVRAARAAQVRAARGATEGRGGDWGGGGE